MRATMGILDMLGLAATLVFAIPVGVYGVQALIGGNLPIGTFCVVVAVLMVAVPNVLTTPSDLVTKLFQGAVGKAVRTPEDE